MSDTATAAPPLPTRRDEAWRYAPHEMLGRLTFGPAPSDPSLPAEIDAQIPALDGPRVVIVNGAVDHGRSDLGAHDGITITTLAGDERPHAGAEPTDAFAAHNVEFGRDGAVITVAADHTADRPVHIVDVTIPGTAHNASSTGIVVDLGAASRATIVETRLGTGEEFAGANAHTTLTLGDGAELDHVVVQDAPADHVSLHGVAAELGADSTLRARTFNLGAAYGRIAYRVTLAGIGAHADLSGLYFGFGDQTLDQQIDIVHAVENCSSRQSFRGVLDDRSTGVFSGGIDVRPGADGTDAEQENHNLLLSDRAEANTQPRLEILADDVSCKHGATVGQLDETALYYMRSRGIREDEARRLLINGFADQVVDDIAYDGLRNWIIDRLGHGTGEPADA